MEVLLEDVLPIATPLIAKYAAIFGRRYGLTQHDREELTQEMWVGVTRRIGRYEASRGEVSAFLTTVIKNRGRSALRLLGRMRNTCRGRVPMDAASEEKAPVQDNVQRLDVRHAVAELPTELREVADLLPHHSKVEVADRLGVSRATLYRRVGELKEKFAEFA